MNAKHNTSVNKMATRIFTHCAGTMLLTNWVIWAEIVRVRGRDCIVRVDGYISFHFMFYFEDEILFYGCRLVAKLQNGWNIGPFKSVNFSTFPSFSSRWKIYHLSLLDMFFWYIMATQHYTDGKQSQFWSEKLATKGGGPP